MNNEEQDTQPQASQAEDNSSMAGENGASTGGSDTAEMSEATTFATDETVANDVADAGAGDAMSEGVGSTDADSSTGGAEMASDSITDATDDVDTSSDTGATSGIEDSTPAEIIAGEARDEQDAQLPGVGATSPDETEAAPQIAQASETSQAEGEPIDQEGSLDTAAEGTRSNTGSGSAYAGNRYGGMDSGSDGDSGSSDSDYEEPIVRTNRLQDVAANASMEDLLRASEQQYRTLKHGDVVEGSIMRVGRDEILVDIGAKTEGIVPSAELQSLTPEEREALAIGDTLLVSVVQPENNEGHAVLSLDRARQERSWRDLQKRFEGGEVIQARVTGYNKGGLLVNLEGVRGFVPSSQISSLTGGNESTKQSEMAKLQGQTIPMKIIEINRSRNRLILSERQAKQEERESVRSRLLRELEPGQIRLGRVSSICDFGAFVDIGGADGLIHLSEISWKRVNNPKDVLSVGDQINVYVLSVDPNERKIALSLKRTQPEPWSTITENYTLGQIVHGTITQLTTFGAFARLEDGIEGLIHVSELAEGRVAHPKNVVNVGDALDLKVIRIDPVKRRIGLSLKRVNEDENAVGAGDGMGTMEDGDETAPNASATRGATGDYNMAPMGQVEAAEGASLVLGEGDATAAADPQAEARNIERMERFARAERPDRNQQQRQQRDRDRDRGQNRPQGGGGEGGNEPMGALAQALGAFMNRDADEEDDTTAPAQTAPDAAVDTVDDTAVEDTGTDVGADAGVDTTADASTDATGDMLADDTATDMASEDTTTDTGSYANMDEGSDAGADDTTTEAAVDTQDEAATETTVDTSIDTAVDSPADVDAGSDATSDATEAAADEVAADEPSAYDVAADEVATETETAPEAAVETADETMSDVQDEAAPDTTGNTEDEA